LNEGQKLCRIKRKHRDDRKPPGFFVSNPRTDALRAVLDYRQADPRDSFDIRRASPQMRRDYGFYLAAQRLFHRVRSHVARIRIDIGKRHGRAAHEHGVEKRGAYV
jgi:hypothetical protein